MTPAGINTPNHPPFKAKSEESLAPNTAMAEETPAGATQLSCQRGKCRIPAWIVYDDAVKNNESILLTL